MAESKKTNEVTVRVNIPEHLRAGSLANVVNITTTPDGFVMFDYVFMHPNDKDNENHQLASLVSRVIVPVDLAQQIKMILSAQLGQIKSE